MLPEKHSAEWCERNPVAAAAEIERLRFAAELALPWMMMVHDRADAGLGDKEPMEISTLRAALQPET